MTDSRYFEAAVYKAPQSSDFFVTQAVRRIGGAARRIGVYTLVHDGPTEPAYRYLLVSRREPAECVG